MAKSTGKKNVQLLEVLWRNAGDTLSGSGSHADPFVGPDKIIREGVIDIDGDDRIAGIAGFGLQLAQLAAEEVAVFENRLDAVKGDFHLLRGIEHAAIFQERNHPASGAHFQVG